MLCSNNDKIFNVIMRLAGQIRGGAEVCCHFQVLFIFKLVVFRPTVAYSSDII